MRGKLARTVLRGPRFRKEMRLPTHPLAVLATRMPWASIEATLVPMFERRAREGRSSEVLDLFGVASKLAGAGISAAGRPRLPIRLMVGLLYLKHAYNESDEVRPESRWSFCSTDEF
jgi:transposase, IS5 family